MDDKLESVFKAFESFSGLNLTIYDLRGRLKTAGLPRERTLHHSPFCLAVKKTRERQCIFCDHDLLFGECLKRREPFIRTCHAGADEVIIPVMQGDELLCVALLGQFVQEGRTSLPKADLPSLARVDHNRSDHLIHLGGIMSGFLANHLMNSVERREPLAQRIYRFIGDHLSSDPSVSDLANELNLSPSRTRHLVKEECGEPFSSLKNSIRLEVAKDLLVRTNASLGFISRQAGFNDVDYFCRFFKKHSGVTAGNYRKSKDAGGPGITV